MARCCKTSGAAGCGEDAAHEYISCSKGPSCQVSSHCTTPSFRSLTSPAIICMQDIYRGSKAAMRMPPTLPPLRVNFRLSLIMCRGAEEDARLPMQGPPEARKPESSTCGTGLCPDGELSFPGTHALLGRAWAPVSVPSHPSCECWQLFELDHHLRRFYHRGCNGALIACSKVHEAHGPHPAAAAAAAANT